MKCKQCKWWACFWEHGNTFTFEIVWMALMKACKERMAIEHNGETVCKPRNRGYNGCRCFNFAG